MNIYLPEDLQAMLREQRDLNVSSICQQAIRAAIRQRQESEKQMETITLNIRSPKIQDGDLVGMNREEPNAAGKLVTTTKLRRVRFVGRNVLEMHHYRFYLTARNRIAVYDIDAGSLESFDDLEEVHAHVRDEDLINDLIDSLGGEWDNAEDIDI